MGIYDRDYYRKEGPSYLDSFSVRGQATKWLLIVTIAVFVLQIATRQQDPRTRQWHAGIVTRTLELDPDAVMSGQVWRLVTYAFLHSDGTVRQGDSFFMHILINMWMLFLFGSYVEEIYGRWEFVAFYLVAALLGGLAFVGESLLRGRHDPCIGASGAVTAVLVLCACHYPRLTILLFFVIPTPVWVLAAFQVVQDVFGFLGGGDKGNTAFSVHLAGAACAFLYFKGELRVLTLFDRIRAWRKERSRPRLRVYRPDDDTREPVPVGPKMAADIDEQFEAKVDAVLEKVARSGQESLTDSEKQILLKASEIYKRRRS